MKAGEVLAWRYRLDARLGVGGMGEVWRATHTGTGRELAIKILHAHAATAESARARFAHEAQASARIKHPAIVDVFDMGELEDGSLYLTMELLDGVLLADALHAEPPLGVHDFVVIMHGVAGALAAAHAAGIIHRDIKPANVFLHRSRDTGFFSPKVLDFGVSKFQNASDSQSTKVGSILGSPRYMSPEQARSASQVDARTDIWAMGVLLFEGLTGTWPHEGDSFSSLVVAICTAPPASIDAVAPGLPESLRAIVRDCLAPLEQRIGSAAALAARLEAALADPSLAGRPLPAPLHPPDREMRSVSGIIVRAPSPAGAIEPPSRAGIAAPRPVESPSSLGVAGAPSAASKRRMPTMTELVSPEMLAQSPAAPRTPPAESAANPATRTGFRPVPKTMRIDDTGELAAHYQAAMAGASAPPASQAPGAPSADPAPRAITFGAPPPMAAPPPRAPLPTALPGARRTSAPLVVAVVVLAVALIGIVVALVLTLRG
ncbi:MAG: protein kinase [Byssovorax sp.]